MARQSTILKAPVFLLTALFNASVFCTPIAAPEMHIVTVEAPPVIVTVTAPTVIAASPDAVVPVKAAEVHENPKAEVIVITTIRTIGKPQATQAPPPVQKQAPPPVVVAPVAAPEMTAPVTPAAKGSAILSDSSYDAGNFKDQMLYATNFFRSQHGATAVTWNDDLAKQSTDWVAGCHFAHSGKQGGGENIAAGLGSVAKTVDGWALEREVYNFDTGNPFSPQNVTGHFTQLVWKGTTSIGCAVKSCSSYDNLPADYGKWFVTCRYAPAGNVGGDDNGYYIKNVAKFNGDLTKGVAVASA